MITKPDPIDTTEFFSIIKRLVIAALVAGSGWLLISFGGIEPDMLLLIPFCAAILVMLGTLGVVVYAGIALYMMGSDRP